MKMSFPPLWLTLLMASAGLVSAQVVIHPGVNGVEVNEAGGTTTVMLSGPARIEWQRFHVNSGESLRYVSSGGSHASLNLVRGALPALIQGSITADGPFYLISPSGIQLGSTGRIQAPQILLSGLAAVNDSALLSGGPAAFRKTGTGLVSIDGQVLATSGGSVTIMGSTVRTGITARIEAPLGRVQVVAAGGTVTGQLDQGFTLERSAAGQGLVNQEGTIAARQVQILSDGFMRNAGRLLASGPANTIQLTAPQVSHELRDGDRSVISTQRLIVQGNFRQEGPVINPDDGANPSPLAGVRQTPRLSGPGFITSIAPGQTQLSHAPLQITKPGTSPIPAPARNPAALAARRGVETKRKVEAGTVRKATFFGQILRR